MKKIAEHSHIIMTVLLYLACVVVCLIILHPGKLPLPPPEGVYIDLKGMLIGLIIFDLAGVIAFYTIIAPYSKKAYNILIFLFTITIFLLLFDGFIGFGLNIVTLCIGFFLVLPRFADKKK